jgi:hypothetical protein
LATKMIQKSIERFQKRLKNDTSLWLGCLLE